MAFRPGRAYLRSMSTPDRPVAFRIDRPASDRAEAAARREAATARIRTETGIDEAMIDALVEGFYARVREDALIGPIFAERIHDWGPHLEQMKLFWSSVALSTGVYQGRPMPKHLPLPIDARHFDRWLEVFEATARELCPPEAAEHFIVRARRIAESLELGVANASGVLVGPGERYRRPETPWAPEAG
ncbi:MAG: group III truncated hemoglobin [Bordetella sp.]|nr:group III truncated hemoglobin [Bordetella sp.]